METTDVRRANLRSIAKKMGGPTKLAEKLGKSTSYIGQIIGRNPTRGIGHKLAREIEETIGLTRGWMDQPHTVAALDAETLIRAVKLVEEAIRQERATLSDEKKARAILRVYKDLQAGKLDLEDVRELILIAG